jgi:competence protein ComEC
MLLPLLVAYFHEVSLVAPLANLIFVPLVGLILLPGMVLGTFLLPLNGPAAKFVFSFLGLVTQKGFHWIRVLAELPAASVLLSPWSLWTWASYGLILLGVWQWDRPRSRAVCIFLSLLILGISCGVRKPFSSERLELFLLDVGQGESMLLRLPNGEAVIIDGGGFPYSDFDMGKNVVAPELLHRGVRRLRAVVLTHADADHYQGLRYLLERFEVAEVWMGAGEGHNPKISDLVSLIRERKIPLKELYAGQMLWEGRSRFQILWPPHTLFQAREEDNFGSGNNRSLVLRVCYGEVCYLLTGDIEAEAERALVGENASLDSQVLKLAHHGSGTSSTEVFLQKIRPRLSLASLGRNNRFKFPHPAVLQNLESLGVKLLRTDLQGELWVATDGKRIFYKTFTGEAGEIGAL